MVGEVGHVRDMLSLGPRVRYTRGICDLVTSCLWPPLPAKAIKLSFYFTQNSSSRFNSVLECRGQMQLYLYDIIVASAWFSKFGDISRKEMCLPGPFKCNRQ